MFIEHSTGDGHWRCSGLESASREGFAIVLADQSANLIAQISRSLWRSQLVCL
jgi:hypothetical protein